MLTIEKAQPCENETRRFKFQPDGNAIYTLRQGDSLSAIAPRLTNSAPGKNTRQSGNHTSSNRDCQNKQSSSGHRIHSGQQLVIPMWMRSLTHGEIPQREITLPPNSPGARAERQARREQTDTPAQTGRGDRTSPAGAATKPRDPATKC